MEGIKAPIERRKEMRATTWNSIGQDVNTCKDLESVLQASGLDYTVEKVPTYTLDQWGQPVAIPNRLATTRNTDEHVYDVVSDKYEVIQNRDAFDFVNYMGDELVFNKAGETANGMVYIIGSLPEVNILGDKFIPHVIFRNGFSGKVKISAAICPLRIVCQNQFNFAFKNAQNSINIRHVGNAEKKLEEAKEVLKLSADYMQELNAAAEHYAGMKLSQGTLNKVLDTMFPMDNLEEMNPYKRKMLEDSRAKFTNAYEADDNYHFRGTAWGLINAYTDFITHKEAMGNTDHKDEGRFLKVTFKSAMMNPVLDAVNQIGGAF